jgi:hypothetical protein
MLRLPSFRYNPCQGLLCNENVPDISDVGILLDILKPSGPGVPAG